MVLLALVLGFLLMRGAHAQSLNIDLGAAGQAGATNKLVQITALITVLSIAPSLMVMVTAFTRIVIVLSLLRSAIGALGLAAQHGDDGLALFLTFFVVMQPVLQQAWVTGLVPMSDGRVATLEGLRLAAEPFRHFMLANLRSSDLQLFLDIAKLPPPPGPDDTPWQALIPRLHHRRAAPRVRDGLSALPAIPGDRHGGVEHPDEHGHDDAAADRGGVAVQADLLRAGRWLADGVGSLVQSFASGS